jgi:hypothetical protein
VRLRGWASTGLVRRGWRAWLMVVRGRGRPVRGRGVRGLGWSVSGVRLIGRSRLIVRGCWGSVAVVRSAIAVVVVVVREVRRHVTGQVTDGHVLTTLHFLTLVRSVVLGVVTRVTGAVIVVVALVRGVPVVVATVLRVMRRCGAYWTRSGARRQLLLSLARSELVTRGVLGQL